MESEQELLKEIQEEYDNSGGKLSLSIKEFEEYFKLERNIAESLIADLSETKRYQFIVGTDFITGKEIKRLQINPRYLRNYWLKSVLVPSEANALLELGFLLTEPYNSGIKNLEIKGQHAVNLSLQNQNIPRLSSLIGDLNHLETLKIQQCQLTALPDTIGNVKNLKVLDLDYNQLMSLPETVGNLKNLRELWCRHNKLTSIPETLTKLVNLQRLALDNNQLSTIPKLIGNLKDINRFSFTFNSLSSLPETIGNLSNLKILELKENKISSLPETIGSLKNLQQLGIQNNQLSSFPQPLLNLNSLIDLNIASNQLTMLPETIKYLTNLQFLNVNTNQLFSLPKSVRDLKNLKVLLALGNQLNSESWELLQELKRSGVRVVKVIQPLIPHFDNKLIKINGVSIRISFVTGVLSTRGQSAFFARSSAIIMVFDKSDRSSVINVRRLFDEVRIQFPAKSITLACVGVITGEEVVSKNEVINFTREHGIDYYETLLHDEETKNQIYQDLVKKILKIDKTDKKIGTMDNYFLQIGILGARKTFKNGTPHDLAYSFVEEASSNRKNVAKDV